MAEAGNPNRGVGPYIGIGIANGAGVGAAHFAATGTPVWIGVFAGAGVGVGAAIDSSRKE